MRLNLGSGGYPLPGYVNVDVVEPADVVGDFTAMTFRDVGEVRMSHVLEHIGWRRTGETLARVRSWMNADARLTVEVPDMAVLFALGPSYPAWQQWLFGEQSHGGEVHLAGFTLASLREAVAVAGFTVETERTFLSEHPARPGYPCVEVVARAS